MGARLSQRTRRRKPAAVSHDRRRAAQARVRAALRVETRAVVKRSVEAALQAEITALVGRERYARRSTAARATTAARCSRCGANWSRRFWRAGSYPRTLLTVGAAVEPRVPRLACRCGGTVPLEFALLGRYERGWGDLQERARELAGLCLSLEDSRVVLGWQSGQVVAASTLNGWVQQAAGLAEAPRAGPLEQVPAVVLLDGIWVTLLEPTGAWVTDHQGRRRERRKRVKRVLLVAYGVDPASGAHWVLDWERASGEDEASWRRVLERLLERGLRTDAGLELVIHDRGSGLEAALEQVHFGPGLLRQRCVFHLLKNLRDAVRGEGLDRAGRRERRRALLDEAAAIWQPTERAEVLRRRAAFCERWGELEPVAVATLERTFGQTLAYLEALERGRERGERWAARYLRTTSLLERLNRAIRQKARQVGAFQATRGPEAGLALVLAHRGRCAPEARPAQAGRTDAWTDDLEACLLPR
ncbi:MAG: transposase [Chloroflexi bacterium]|nr:transposase [Chloroflexota bacterium]